MSSRALIDAQFDRAVEIIQSLPKTGPIQTDYEEKLTMYSLYKQATIGNVKSPRPAMWDMLGRAKWDAWAKHKDLESYEAKWLYVDALMKVLRKYSDKTIATNLVQELESYGGDPANLVISRTLSRSNQSDSSGSTASVAEIPSHLPATDNPRASQIQQPEAESSEDEDESENEGQDPSIHLDAANSIAQPHINRPQSSLSSHRYRTPMAGSLAMSPPPPHQQHPHGIVPAVQPLPGFETPSAFAETSTTPSSLYPVGSSYIGQFSESSRGEIISPPNINVYPSPYHGQLQPQPRQQYNTPPPMRPGSRPTLERAVENVQAHLAALTERLESLEAITLNPNSRSHISPLSRTPSWGPGRGSPSGGMYNGNNNDILEWDLDDLGMWSLVLNPLSRALRHLRTVAQFFASNEHQVHNRSPGMIVLRRLCLDMSFLVCVLAVVRAVWRRSGARRREVRMALGVLWRAILGRGGGRTMIERGV